MATPASSFQFMPAAFLKKEDDVGEEAARGGWGPPQQMVHSNKALKDLPFAPYSVSDRLGRAADWQSGGYGKFKDNNKGVAAIFNFNATEDVRNKPVHQHKHTSPRIASRMEQSSIAPCSRIDKYVDLHERARSMWMRKRATDGRFLMFFLGWFGGGGGR